MTIQAISKRNLLEIPLCNKTIHLELLETRDNIFILKTRNEYIELLYSLNSWLQENHMNIDQSLSFDEKDHKNDTKGNEFEVIKHDNNEFYIKSGNKVLSINSSKNLSDSCFYTYGLQKPVVQYSSIGKYNTIKLEKQDNKIEKLAYNDGWNQDQIPDWRLMLQYSEFCNSNLNFTDLKRSPDYRYIFTIDNLGYLKQWCAWNYKLVKDYKNLSYERYSERFIGIQYEEMVIKISITQNGQYLIALNRGVRGSILR